MTNIPLPSVFSRRRWVRRVWSPLKINAMKALIRKVRGAPWKLAGGKVLAVQFGILYVSIILTCDCSEEENKTYF